MQANSKTGMMGRESSLLPILCSLGTTFWCGALDGYLMSCFLYTYPFSFWLFFSFSCSRAFVFIRILPSSCLLASMCSDSLLSKSSNLVLKFLKKKLKCTQFQCFVTITAVQQLFLKQNVRKLVIANTESVKNLKLYGETERTNLTTPAHAPIYTDNS